MTEVLPVTVAETARLGERVLAEVEQVIVGKPEAIRLVLLGVLASGHILIEDLPGLGKTLLARATGAGLVRSGSAVRMAGLFRRARYSSEPMTSADSAAAAAALDQMQADLGPAHESSAHE